MSNLKVVKKGEVLFRENEKVQFLYLIQSGSFNCCLIKPKKNIELFVAGPNQVMGDATLVGTGIHPFSAVATVESKVLEIPADVFKGTVEQSSLKPVLKALAERSRVLVSDLKSFKLEKDASPCPDEQTAHLFGSLAMAVSKKGEKDPKSSEHYTCEWNLLKNFSQRLFLVSPKKLEQSLVLLKKIGLAELHFGKLPEDPEGPDQLLKVEIYDLSKVELFAEFFQHHYFKNGKTDLLKFDDWSFQVHQTILQLTSKGSVDRHGHVTLPYALAVDHIKAQLNIQLNSDNYARLVNKGSSLHRKTMSDGTTVLQFDPRDCEQTTVNWKILREIEKWNEKGFIDLTEETAGKKSNSSGCPSCGAGIHGQAKFCSECGQKLAS